MKGGFDRQRDYGGGKWAWICITQLRKFWDDGLKFYGFEEDIFPREFMISNGG